MVFAFVVVVLATLDLVLLPVAVFRLVTLAFVVFILFGFATVGLVLLPVVGFRLVGLALTVVFLVTLILLPVVAFRLLGLTLVVFALTTFGFPTTMPVVWSSFMAPDSIIHSSVLFCRHCADGLLNTMGRSCSYSPWWFGSILLGQFEPGDQERLA